MTREELLEEAKQGVTKIQDVWASILDQLSGFTTLDGNQLVWLMNQADESEVDEAVMAGIVLAFCYHQGWLELGRSLPRYMMIRHYLSWQILAHWRIEQAVSAEMDFQGKNISELKQEKNNLMAEIRSEISERFMLPEPDITKEAHQAIAKVCPSFPGELSAAPMLKQVWTGDQDREALVERQKAKALQAFCRENDIEPEEVKGNPEDYPEVDVYPLYLVNPGSALKSTLGHIEAQHHEWEDHEAFAPY